MLSSTTPGTCPPVRAPARLYGHLPACTSTCPHAWAPALMHWAPALMHGHLPACTGTCLPAHAPACLHAHFCPFAQALGTCHTPAHRHYPFTLSHPHPADSEYTTNNYNVIYIYHIPPARGPLNKSRVLGGTPSHQAHSVRCCLWGIFS